jgi:hypothetical protein
VGDSDSSDSDFASCPFDLPPGTKEDLLKAKKNKKPDDLLYNPCEDEQDAYWVNKQLSSA